VYALYASPVFLFAAGIVFAPVVRLFMHKIHWEQ